MTLEQSLPCAPVVEWLSSTKYLGLGQRTPAFVPTGFSDSFVLFCSCTFCLVLCLMIVVPIRPLLQLAAKNERVRELESSNQDLQGRLEQTLAKLERSG